MSNNNLDLIYKNALALSYNEQLKLISKLTTSLQQAKHKKKHKLSELQGLGKKLWKKTNSDQYLKNLREEWNDR